MNHCLGKLFSLAGDLIAVVQAPNCKIHVEGKEFEAVVGGSLTLILWNTTDTSERAHKETVARLAAELHKCRDQLLAVEIQLGSSAIAGDEALITREHALKKRIAELEQMKEVSVTYKEFKSGVSAELKAGVVTELGWFTQPVVWCPTVTPKEEHQVVERTKMMPVHPPAPSLDPCPTMAIMRLI